MSITISRTYFFDATSRAGATTDSAAGVQRYFSTLQIDSEPAALGFQRYPMAAALELHTSEHTRAHPLIGAFA